MAIRCYAPFRGEPLHLPHSTLNVYRVPAHMDIDLPTNEDFYLETGVFDWETGKAGTMEISLKPESGRSN
jgi:hypothetical protein